MYTIDDIQFDNNYAHASRLFLLLHDHSDFQDGTSLVVDLPHAKLLTFVRTVSNLLNCQEFISNQPNKMITLFTNNRKLATWNDQNNETTFNLRELYIFCDGLHSLSRMVRWNGCYKDRVKDTFMHDDLDYELLYVGIRHIKKSSKEFPEDSGLHRKFLLDGQRISMALGNWFGHRASFNDAKLSEEASVP